MHKLGVSIETGTINQSGNIITFIGEVRARQYNKSTQLLGSGIVKEINFGATTSVKIDTNSTRFNTVIRGVSPKEGKITMSGSEQLADPAKIRYYTLPDVHQSAILFTDGNSNAVLVTHRVISK